MHVFYLHGFASSPASSKAAFLAGRLAPYGATLHVPDLNAPDFSTLTTTRMVAQVRADLAALRPASAVLVGSSLGAFVAWHVAAQEEASGHPPVALVLLAPALDFGHHRMAGLSDAEFDAWRATGWHTFQHYATGEPRRVHYALFDDARRYDSWATPVRTRALALMGRHDAVVSPAMVRRFCDANRNVRLVWLDDDHQLDSSLERIWEESAAFLGLGIAGR